MSKYQYMLQPRTYKTVERVIDEFYQYCTDNQLSPTLIRFEKYVKANKYTNQSNKEKSL